VYIMVHYTLKLTSTYSVTFDTFKQQLTQGLRLYLGGLLEA